MKQRQNENIQDLCNEKYKPELRKINEELSK